MTKKQIIKHLIHAKKWGGYASGYYLEEALKLTAKEVKDKYTLGYYSSFIN